MKHRWDITLLLLFFFLLAQYIGLLVVYQYIDPVQTAAAGEPVFKELPIGERPPVREETSYVYVLAAIIIGTLLALLLIKLSWFLVWKIWFLFAIVLSLTVAWAAFLPAGWAFVLALGAGLWRIFRPQFLIQNMTELFLYGGLAAIFVPLFNLWSISVLLVLIALYDAYAVWKSKHMITLAKSQMKAKMFAGLLVPYAKAKLSVAKGQGKKFKKVKMAVLGGGDIGFPLLLAGVVLKEWGLWPSLLIPLFALAGLGVLLWQGDHKKFYPAMPFIAAGCFVGLGVVWLLRFFLG